MHKTVTLTVKENVNLRWSRKPGCIPHLRVTSGTRELPGNRTVSDGPISRLLLSSTRSKTFSPGPPQLSKKRRLHLLAQALDLCLREGFTAH